jgi:tRNA (guanine-N7-)-methyltransferase
MSDTSSSRNAIRSFVRRAGRLTTAQSRGLQQLLPEFGIAFSDSLIDLNETFGRRAPHVVEVGFGNGALLLDAAQANPETDFVGIEVHEPGVGHCLIEMEARGLTNIRIICHDAVEVLRQQFANGSLDAVYLFFPDPWPKKRHHKRRIVQANFVALLAEKIRRGGTFCTATDWAPYAEHIQQTVAGNTSFDTGGTTLGDRRQTKFEQRGKRLGHAIWERAYRRI